ncbi:MAG: divalent-cation tolerance protein CutA [Chlamydiia bacterium]|nr:divalent-cation tolerance protein CutA [Chlamydiia bacterium]
MTEIIEISWAAGSIDEARKVSRYLVQEKWIASAKIIPWIESIYLLDGQLESEQESKVVFKALKGNFEKILKVIEQNSKYDIPEVLYKTIEGGSEAYLNWLKESSQ